METSNLSGYGTIEAAAAAGKSTATATSALSTGATVGYAAVAAVVLAGLAVGGFYIAEDVIIATPASTASTSSISWGVFKHTMSISSKTYSDVALFSEKYLGPTSTSNLGCSTMKVVTSLHSNDDSNLREIHWVDSSVFSQSGMSITQWSTYLSDLGTDDFNVFMHNKIQLYVPDIEPHRKKLSIDGIDTILRLSGSNGSSVKDTAHIGYWMSEANAMYELVGPSSSLSSAELQSFSDWRKSECIESHYLYHPIEYYSAAYHRISYSSTSSNWTDTTGLPVPMAVSIGIPASSLDAVSETTAFLTNLTNIAPTVLADGTCSIAIFDFGSTSSEFEVTLRYVSNTDASQGTTYTMSDWESAVQLSHDTFINMSAPYLYSGWDRYLDTHVGISPYYYDNSTCWDINDLAISSIGSTTYVTRIHEGGYHHYVGNKGIMSFEVDPFNCSFFESTVSYDLCGCIWTNSEYQYQALTDTFNETCVESDVVCHLRKPSKN